MTNQSGNSSKPFQNTGISEGFFREINIEYLIHELKDPIAVIESGVRSLLERQEKYGSLSPRQEKILKRTLRNSHKARGMLKNLLEVGRSEAGCFCCHRFKPVQSIYDVLNDMLDILASDIAEPLQNLPDPEKVRQVLAEHGIILMIDSRMEQTEIIQDETKFRQVVGNLVKNALHFRSQTVEIRVSCDLSHLMVEVVDDGPGINPAYHQLIFEQFKQVDTCLLPTRNGHGLGLSGSRIMARCLGGDIELDSCEGQGATFRLRLPLAYSGGAA